MQDFKQILIKKAKIIGELKYPSHSNRLSILKYLKSIKKQQKQSQHHDHQILLSLTTLKFQQKQDLQKVYFLSFTIMKSLCKKFQFMPEEHDIFANIVEMHYKFYIKQSALQQAQQVRHIYRKKAYDRDIFLTNLLSWLYDWGKKKLQKFLNKNILSIQKDLLADKLQSPKKLGQFVLNGHQTSPIKQLMFEGTFLNISYSQKISKSEKKQQFKIIINGNNNLFQQQGIQTSPFISRDIIYQEDVQLSNEQSKRMQTSFQPQRSDQLAPKNLFLKQRSKSYNKEYLDKSITLTNLNKEIFYGICWKQMNQVYRNMNCISDLDMYYLKTFKKQKQEIKQEVITNRIDQIAESMIKSMPKIKKSIQLYSKEYNKFCPIEIKDFHTYSSKMLVTESQNKISKYLSVNRKQQTKLNHQPRVYQKLKSQQRIFQDQSAQKIITNKSSVHKLRQRNKSLNDSILRKPTQQKVQMQVKLPIVYNPQHFYNIADSDAQKALAIHQKFQKFMLNGVRPNKGLARYKHLNKQREKNNLQNNEILDLQLNQYGSTSSQLDYKKDHEYEVANIRRILRKRQKQRLVVSKTPIIQRQKSKQQQTMQKIMLHIKVMQAQAQAQNKQRKQTDKFDVFLNNFKQTSSSPFSIRTNSKSLNFGSLKSNEFNYRYSFKDQNNQFLPKIA